MSFLENIDTAIFFFFNHTLHTRSIDAIAPYWRSMFFWLPFYLFLIAFLVLNFSKKSVPLLVSIAITVGLTDTISNRIIKKTVKRARPCNDERIRSDVKLLVPCGSGYSFTSNHAANHFALSTFLALTLFAKRRFLQSFLFVWAASIALMQVYVGLHYPLDVLCGGLLGVAVGLLVTQLLKRFTPQYLLTLS